MAAIKPGLAFGLIFATIVAVAVIVIVIVIVVRRIRPAENQEDENLDENPALDGILCTSNDQCASGACNTIAGICVDCLVNDDCGATLPFCKTDSNVCVECLETNDCDSPEVCTNNQCCQDTKPEITGIVATFTSNRGIEIDYNIFQPRNRAKVLLIIENPATGKVIGRAGCPDAISAECVSVPGCEKPCIEFPATSPILVLKEANVGFKFYGGASYRFRMQIQYQCGGSSVQITDMSDPFDYLMPACPDTPAAGVFALTTRFFFRISRSLPPTRTLVESFPFIITTVPNGGENFSVTILVFDAPGQHPNFSLLEIGGVTENGPGPDEANPDYNITNKVVSLPYIEPGTIQSGQPYYFRLYRNGDIGECDGNVILSQEASWTF